MASTNVEPSAHSDDRRKRALEHAQNYIERLRKLHTDQTGRGRGELAALRRNAGNTLEEGRNVTWFYRYLPPRDDSALSATDKYRGERADEIYFLVATLFADDRQALEQGRFASSNMGASLRLLRPAPKDPKEKDKLSEPGRRDKAERRLSILLDAELDAGGGELAFRLRQTVKLLTSNDILINWPLLLVDLLDWDRPDKRVQKRWARSFYDVSREAAPDDEDQEPASSESDEADVA